MLLFVFFAFPKEHSSLSLLFTFWQAITIISSLPFLFPIKFILISLTLQLPQDYFSPKAHQKEFSFYFFELSRYATYLASCRAQQFRLIASIQVLLSKSIILDPQTMSGILRMVNLSLSQTYICFLDRLF